ncbi:Indoleamine 2,3-dioxygenase [Zancudomyces culisetae]|uniref:Indoleamine 2,3-dioxygenase n=1 Tax=Zancudomyces culisetae TaxID=1213189 RepID=A0A1R1PL05_ZANCU|nr:Indoleamine 2,3-dioxygenase [Zancudomyces culisetae]|eukprot:OMH81645.1 Indoleamine 2,3-dioxygenase [Zancudomyces culisetae]
MSATNETIDWSFLPKTLDQYEVNLESGFIPAEEPLSRLPNPYYEPWEELASNISQYLLAKVLRDKVKSMPVLTIEKLATRREEHRAYVVLCFLSHAYIWGLNQKAEQVLPASLAVPWWNISKKLRIKPVFTNAASVVWNWNLIDKNRPIGLDNLKHGMLFTGSFDEAWFFLVTVAMDAKSGAILRNIGKIINDISKGDVSAVTSGLEKLSTHINDLRLLLARMFENCDPYVFYWRMRQYMAGWKNMKEAGLEHGVKYEGVMDEADGTQSEYQEFYGGNAAQSSTIQLIDIALGVHHYPINVGVENGATDGNKAQNIDTMKAEMKAKYPKPPGNPFLMEMRDYMPGTHKDLLEDMGKVCHIREFVLINTDGVSRIDYEKFQAEIERVSADDISLKNISGDDLKLKNGLLKAYNKCISNLKVFRDYHMIIVKKYIVNQAKGHSFMGSNAPDTTPTPPKSATSSPVQDKAQTIGNASGGAVSGADSKVAGPKSVVAAHTNGIKPGKLARFVEEGDVIKGTGGTDPIEFLTHIKNETRDSRI